MTDLEQLLVGPFVFVVSVIIGIFVFIVLEEADKGSK